MSVRKRPKWASRVARLDTVLGRQVPRLAFQIRDEQRPQRRGAVGESVLERVGLVRWMAVACRRCRGGTALGGRTRCALR